MFDDESMCNVTCPISCTCTGLSFNCDSSDASFSIIQLSHKARRIDISKSNISSITKGDFPYLVHLDLSDSLLQFIETDALDSMINLQTLDVRNASLKELKKGVFKRVSRLVNLYITGNADLTSIEVGAFQGLKMLKKLDLSGLPLRHIHSKQFDGMSSLTHLSLRNSKIHTIEKNSFHGLNRIKSIDLSENSIKNVPLDLFQNLPQLHQMTASAAMCCLAKLNTEQCPREMDMISSCEHLIRSDVIRNVLLIISIISIMMSAILFYAILVIRSGDILLKVLLLISQILISILLLSVVSRDYFVSPYFKISADEWITGIGCRALGFIGSFGLELSIFTLFLIVINKLIAKANNIVKMSREFVAVEAVMAVVLSAVLAGIPLSTSSKKIYNGYTDLPICFGFFVTSGPTIETAYNFIVFCVLNCLISALLFLLLPVVFFMPVRNFDKESESENSNTNDIVKDKSSNTSKDPKGDSVVFICSMALLCVLIWIPASMIGKH